MQQLTCNNCQKDFIPSRINYSNPKKFCSHSCASAYKTIKILKPCKVCSTDTLNPMFCSLSCAATHNNSVKPKRIAKPKIPKKIKPVLTNEERHKRKRAIANEAWARYMSKRKYQTPSDENRKALQEFYANCPKGYEVDHVIPISKGGLHSLSNLQYLTKSENRKKSNKIIGTS